MSDETFAVALTRLRAERKLSLIELARLAHIDPGHLSRISRGLRPPPAPEIVNALDEALAAQGPLIAMANAHSYVQRGQPGTRANALELIHGTLDPWASAQMPPHQLGLAAESPAWFGFRLAHLITTVDTWTDLADQADALQELLHREITMFDSSAPSDPPVLHSVSRRQALLTLAALPVAFATSPSSSSGTAATTEHFLARCAASITACWHLLRGTDLNQVDQLLSAYILPLQAVAQRPSNYQQAAAKLASQAHRLSGIVALHRNQLGVREHHCKQALIYAAAARHPSSSASALISLASTYFYKADPVQAASLYQHALTYESSISSLQRSRIYAELGVIYGQLNQETDALRSLDQADTLYPNDPESDPSYLYAEFTRASFALERGLTYLALAEHFPTRHYKHAAAEIFAAVENASASSVPDRIRYEVNNYQARVAVLLDDLVSFEEYADRGIHGAALLRSIQRRRELHSAFQRASQRWPQERRLARIKQRLQLDSAPEQTDP